MDWQKRGTAIRDVWRAKKTGSALPSFTGRGFSGRSSNQMHNSRTSRGGGGTSASSSHDRKTFFRALACAALDILSRSLRRKSFVRVASALMGVQFICVLLWWSALRVVLSVEIFNEDGVVTKFMHLLWLLSALVAGKWATGTVARLLGFIASGGVASWFAQQTVMIEEVRAREMQQQQLTQQGNAGKDSTEYNPTGYASSYANARAKLHAMPEAYRAADASVYASVMDFDDGLDDDYEEDERDGGAASFSQQRRSSFSLSSSTGGNVSGGMASLSNQSSTVKSFLITGCTISFGSVAQCGLLGGLAQFLWSVVRNMDAMGFFLQRRFSNSTSSSSGFRGMDISSDSPGAMSSPRWWKQTTAYWWRRTDVAIRGFVRSHSDLAMSHVAAYFKSYQRAANDVIALIESSGVEPIIHDDITTHMCSALCSVVSGCIVVLFGMLLTTHRNTTTSSKNAAGNAPLDDLSLLEILLFAYILCYTLLFTALEPLRAAIKAVYVCFAEHPLSLSQAFPLIYQRLSRISDASGSV